MLIHPSFRDCVAFLGCDTSEGEQYGGTTFFIRYPWHWDERIRYGLEFRRGSLYFVTTKHSLDAIAYLGCSQARLRINRVGGGLTTLETKLGDWITHPTDSSVDLAVLPVDIHRETSGYDLSAYQLERENLAHPFVETRRMTHDEWDNSAFEIGDEVFFPGLFRRHLGEERNIPIVRTGTIAAMQQEKVPARFGKHHPPTPIDAYLVEVRSIGGLSGSPVFFYFTGQNRRGAYGSQPRGYFLGIMQGHFDQKIEADSSTLTDEEEKINMGIGIVIPAEKLLEILDRDDLKEQRERAEREYNESRGSTPDLAEGTGNT
jgi:hypothetical protein